jgi:hypothetical protein
MSRSKRLHAPMGGPSARCARCILEEMPAKHRRVRALQFMLRKSRRLKGGIVRKGKHLGLLVIAVATAPALGAGNTPNSPLAGNSHAVLQIKPGLWEFSDTPKVTGDTLISDAMLATVPAAQRAQYLAETRKMMAQPSRERECFAQATFEQRVLSVGSGCTQTVVSNTASRIEVLTECRAESGGLKQYNSRKLTAPNPISVTTSFHAVVTRQGKTMTIDSIENGRWLNSSCGNVKGIQQLQ